MALSLGESSQNPFPFTYPDYQAMRDGQQSLSGITVYNMPSPVSLTGKGKPERAWGVVTSANYFDVLGVRPVLGRTFLPAEDERPNGAPVAVISYQLWQTDFGGDPQVVGRTMDINQHRYTIVGVTPAGFQGSQTGIRSDLWVPISMEGQFIPLGDLLHDHHNFWLFAMGRLKPGVTPEQAREEMTLRIKPEVKNYPQEHKGHDRVTVYPLWRAPFSANALFYLLLPMLMAIAGVVLLLACANVANLMLCAGRGAAEGACDSHVTGSHRWRLVRQLLIESLVLAFAGGAIAMLITLWTAGSMTRFYAANGLSVPAEYPADPHGTDCDGADFTVDGRDFWDLAGTAGIGRGAGGRAEGGEREPLGGAEERAAGEWAGGSANFTFVAAAGVRGAIYSKLPECPADRCGGSTREECCWHRSIYFRRGMRRRTGLRSTGSWWPSWRRCRGCSLCRCRAACRWGWAAGQPA